MVPIPSPKHIKHFAKPCFNDAFVPLELPGVLTWAECIRGKGLIWHPAAKHARSTYLESLALPTTSFVATTGIDWMCPLPLSLLLPCCASNIYQLLDRWWFPSMKQHNLVILHDQQTFDITTSQCYFLIINPYSPLVLTIFQHHHCYPPYHIIIWNHYQHVSTNITNLQQ